MKTVSKKFLEEQVRLALKENTGRVRNINEEDEGFDWGQLGREILIGADASWEQVIDLHNNTLRYGIGPQSHISRAINATKQIGAFESFVFKFIKTAPLSAGGDVQVSWDEKLMDLIFNQCDATAKELKKKLDRGDSKGVYLIFKDFIQEKIFDEIFDDYGISDTNTKDIGIFNYFAGTETSKIKTTFRPNDKWCKQISRSHFKKGDTVREISINLEKAICETSYALRKTPSGKQALSFFDMQLETPQSRLPAIVAATIHAEYSRIQSEPLSALVSVADITLTLVGNISIIFTFGAGKVYQMLGSKALMTLAARTGLQNSVRAAKVAKAIQKAAAINKKLGTGKIVALELGFTGAVVGHQLYNDFERRLGNLEEATVEYFKIFKTTKNKEELNDLLEDIRKYWVIVIDQFIKIQKVYAGAMQDPEFENQAIELLETAKSDGAAAVPEILALYEKGDENAAMGRVAAFSDFAAKAKKVTKSIKDNAEKAQGQVDRLNSSTKEIDDKKSDIDKKTLDSLKPTERARTRVGVKQKEEEPAQEVEIEQPESEEVPQSEPDKTSFGSNEKTSDETLRDIQEYLSQLQEQNSSGSKEILVNLGNRDALEFAKGNENFSPEKTISNIKKISDLAAAKGFIVKFSPVPKLLSSHEGVDDDRYSFFSKQINGHMRGVQQVTTPDPVQPSSVPAAKPVASSVKKKEPAQDSADSAEREKEEEQEEEQDDEPKVTPPAEAARAFEERVTKIEELENFKHLVVYMTILYGTMKNNVKSNVVRLQAHVEDINSSDLSGYRDNKFKELTANVHRKNRSKLLSLYKDEKLKDEEKANRLMALLHRPRLITYIPTDFLLYTMHDGFNLSFEMGPPHGNKVGVALGERDFLRSSSFGNGIEKQELQRIFVQNRDTFEKLRDKLLSFGPAELEVGDLGPNDKRQYLNFLNSYVTLFNSGIEALKDQGSSLRRSWIIDNLSAACYLLS